jgi:paraquat-inducible protein B
MRRRANPTLIGAFVAGGLALLALAIIFVAGNDLFTRKERVVMHFSGSTYGLQVGAPVVFRGVRVGSVTSISVVYDRASDSYSIPVFADLERRSLRGLDGERAEGDSAAAPSLQTLVERGLRAQLSMQSLLTGLLYVDLDLRPERPARLRGARSGVVEIPTHSTAIQNLKNQLENLDIQRLVEDLSAVAAAARALATAPELKQALTDLAKITGDASRLSARLERDLGPLAGDMRRGIDRLGSASDSVRGAAERFEQTSTRLSALLAPDAPLVRDLQRTADEMAQAAQSLRQASADDSALTRNAERALQDLSRASRTLRELAEVLQAHPEALIRGRPRNE